MKQKRSLDTDKVSVVLNLAHHHNYYMEERIDLVASNSWISNYARLVMSSYLSNNYSIGIPGERLYGGCFYIDIIEREVISIAKELYEFKHSIVQFLSGMQANIAAYYAILSEGDTVMATPTRYGGHYSHTAEGPLRFFKPRMISVPFDEKKYNIDLTAFEEIMKKERPKLLIIGWSEFLFPYDLVTVRRICDECDTVLMYDMSHVAGLIAGGRFQPDVNQFADILTSSTGKSLHAPDHGFLMYNDPDYSSKLREAIMPVLTSNTHPQEMAALGVALSEWLQFGSAYADQVIRNSKRLGRELKNRGVNVLYEDLDFTESHTILIKHDDPDHAVRILDRAGILCNACELPHDIDGKHSGIRFGTQVITRRGMKEDEISRIAEAIAHIILYKDNPDVIRMEYIWPLAKSFQSTYYSFDATFPDYEQWMETPYHKIKIDSTTGFLRTLRSLTYCTDDEIKLIAQKGVRASFKEGTTITQAGDKPKYFNLVISGTVYILDKSGTVINKLSKTDHWGESEIYLNEKYIYSALAIEDTELLRATKEDFKKILNDYPMVKSYFEKYIIPQS